ncbi:MAG: hypothetical protein ACWGSQ_01910 [Longimicrobiales bacterium]
MDESRFRIGRGLVSKRGLLLRLASELVIIFAGVYGAFWVERYQQALEDRDRAVTILEALEREISQFSGEGRYVQEGIAASLASYDSAVALGVRAAPAYYREPGAETPSVSVWEATVASGGVNLLDPGLFYDLAAFYNRVQSFSQRYLRYNQITEQEILPRLSLGAQAFYDPHSGELDPIFEVHMDQLRTLRDEATHIIARADTLGEKVRAEGERLR